MASIKNLIAIDIILSHTGVKDTLDNLQSSFNGLMSNITSSATGANADIIKAADGMINVGGKISGVGGVLTSFITGPLVGLGTVAVNASREFESAFAGVKKTVDETANTSFKDLSDGIRQMATEIPAAVTEIAAVAEAAGQLGISADDVLEFTEVMVNLGVSTNMSAEQAATALARIANVMGNTADEYERMGSTIVYLGNNFATTETEIANMSTRISTAASNLNMTTAEVMGLAAGLTSIGITAEAGGTAISKFLSSMAFASDVGNKSLKELEQQTGLTGREMELMSSNNSKGFKELASELGMTTTEMNKVIKAGKDLNTMSEISGMEAEEFAKIVREQPVEAFLMFIDGLANAQDAMMENGEASESLISLLNELGISEVRMTALLKGSASAHDLIRDAIYGANEAWDDNTALTKEASARYETFDSQIQLMKNSWKDVMIAIGDQLVPYLKTLNEWLKNLADNIRNMKPEDFKRIVDLLIKVATIGPTLMITGKAMNLIGNGIKLAQGAEAILGKILSNTMGLNKEFQGGGWTAQLVRQLRLIVDESGKVRTATGQFVSPDATKHLSKLSDEVLASTKGLSAFKSNVSLAGETLKVKLTSGLTTAKTAGSTLMKSSLFKGAGWLALGAYALDIANQFGILKAIWEPFKGLSDTVSSALGGVFNSIKDMPDKLTGGILGWKDLGIGIAGAIGIATGVAPVMGGVAAALVGVKTVLGLVSDANDTANERTTLYNGVLEANKTAFAGITTEYDKFVNSTSPSLIEAYKSISNSLSMNKIFPDNEDFAVSKGSVDKYIQDTTTALDTRYGMIKTTLSSYYEEIGIADSGFALAVMKNAEESHLKIVDEKQKEVDAIQELFKKNGEDVSVWNEEEKTKLQTHLNALNEIIINTIPPEEQKLNTMMEDIWKSRKETGIGLTEEQLKTTSDLVYAAMERDKATLANKHQTDLEAIGDNNELKAVAEARHNKEIFELYDRFVFDYLGKISNFNKENVEKAAELNADIERLEKEKTKTVLTEVNGMVVETKGFHDEATENAYNAKVKELEDLKEHLALSKEEQQAAMTFLKEKIPSEYHALYGLVGDELDLGALEVARKTADMVEDMGKEIDSHKGVMNTAGKDLVEEVVEGIDEGRKHIPNKLGEIIDASEQKFREADEWGSLGENIPAGVAKGIDRGSSAPLFSVGKLARNLKLKFMRETDQHSPSKLFAKLGGFLTEGIAIGIDDGADSALESMADVAHGLEDIMDIDSKFDSQLSRSLKTSVDVSSTGGFKNAIVEAFAQAIKEAGPLVTYFTEETAEEAVNSVLRTQTSGPYGG